MNNKSFGILALLSTGMAYGMIKEVQEDYEVILQCDFNVEYPVWTGPDGLASPLTTGQTIQEPGIEWFNKKDLNITKAMLKHDGNYTCSDGNGNSKMVELDVQYFSGWAEFTTATPENTMTTFTCWCRSNPRCTIVPETVSHGRPGVGSTLGLDSKTTFHPCASDPTAENRTKCSVTVQMHVAKEDNGVMENSCKFNYKNSTILTLSPQVKFLFPPTSVNITAEKEESMLNLTCSIDSSNPVSLLKWYRGIKATPSSNGEISSSYQSYVMDAEYNGQNITQSIDIKRDSIQDGEKAFCCAEHRDQQICESFALGTYKTTSAGSCVTSWVALVVVGVALLAI
ncbi:uncharacterized protein LOC123561063 isoform X2 [Mercenaria mercenaria]|uniref:uncharacterized protein LOC123561063 isoform X2 n=1 Tax=Mercenaria mercenaria TaxID=6596 RepID=UPI00234EC5A0|nr:uncharacterized protein LOC123561063 isoform X2 [Mercenaria mercenaria]